MQVDTNVVEVDFIMVDAFSPYTAIMGRPWLHTLGTVSSTLHQKVKYPSGDQVFEIVRSQSVARQCLVATIQYKPEADTSTIAENDLQQLETPASLLSEPVDEVKCEDLEKVVIGDDPEKFFQIGTQMPLLEKGQLVDFLRKNVDVFAQDAYKTPGVDLNFICHYLNVNPSITPRRQPPRRPSKEHVEAVKNEVTILKQAGAIKEVFYPQQLADTVVVKKKTGKWRVCVDFTNLNKACPKDHFPRPQIDQLVDATVGHPWMSFLDAFQGYHQRPLTLDDQEKTVFVTPVGNYHYKVMPFGLKNAGSTYQRMMTKMFEPRLGRNVEVYIDDMIVKSKLVSEHVGDLTSIFEILKEHKLRLNASKCSFGMGSGKFLGYMVTHRGIKVNPDQIKAINNL